MSRFTSKPTTTRNLQTCLKNDGLYPVTGDAYIPGMLHLNYAIGAQDAFSKYAVNAQEMAAHFAANPNPTPQQNRAFVDQGHNQAQTGAMLPSAIPGMPNQMSFGAPPPGAFAEHGAQEPNAPTYIAPGNSQSTTNQRAPTAPAAPKITAQPAAPMGLAAPGAMPPPKPQLPTVAPKIAPMPHGVPIPLMKRAQQEALALFGLQALA